jgi:exo-1,4-beta-D-glucosaminidase
MGPGGAVPPLESLKAMLPSAHVWPIDEYWKFHAGGDEFKDLDLFTSALEARYGKAGSAEDYAKKAQALAYDNHRAMFEAFGRNKYTATGVIQWMLNNAWPSMIWHLYDWYLRPGGSYFGAKKAGEPLHVQYSYDDRSVVVVNDLQQPFAGLKVKAEVFDLDLKPRFSGEATVDVAADGVARALVLPEVADLTRTYFVRLELSDAKGALVSHNFYWLSTKPDVLAWKDAKWYYTPTAEHADLTALASLPATTLEIKAVRAMGNPAASVITVKNTGSALAFQVRLEMVDATTGEERLPVFWEDNYIELFPGESRQLRVEHQTPSSGPMRLQASAWNAPLVFE